MTQQVNFSLPEQQNALVQFNLIPPTDITGWTVQFDQLYHATAQQPIFSLFLASGYTTGQSGMNLVDASMGVFNANLGPTQVSGLSLSTEVLAYRVWRIDAGKMAPLTVGYRLLSNF